MPRVFPLPHIARAVLVVGNGEANLLRGHPGSMEVKGGQKRSKEVENLAN